MQKVIEDTVKSYEEGRVSRRQFVGQLTALVALLSQTNKAVLGSETAPSTFEALELNHLAIGVTDIDRTQKFYEQHLGMKLIFSLPTWRFMGFGTHFIAFMKKEKPGMDHFGLTIENYNPKEAVARLKDSGLETSVSGEMTYFFDPDRNMIQLAGDDHPGGRPKPTPELLKKIYDQNRV